MENGFDTSYLIPGTDGPTIAWYRSLGQRAQESFELLEDEVVVVDTETTGLDPARDQIIEIAACILRGPEVVDRFQTFVDPGRPIPAEITELTGIAQEDVAGAPDPSLAVELFATWADGRDLVAHNASFDRGVIMRQAQPGAITGRWMDSLALSRIVLPRMRGHRLADLSRAFGLPASTHRAADDVEATAALWRILLAGVYSLPAGMAQLIAGISPASSWSLRHLFAQAAQMTQGAEEWSLRRSRSRRFIEDNLANIADAEDEAPPAVFPTDAELRRAFSAEGAAGRMYPGYEPRPEQLAMALEVGEALRTGTHRCLEAGTGVGKSMAYLLPLALAAKANPGLTAGVATKTNALMDQLVYAELPRLAEALGGLRYIALKGYDHYPCLRKLEAQVRDKEQERRPELIEMLAVLLAYVSQTAWGDLDALSLPWYGLPRYAVVANSEDCLKSRCPFFPTRCYLHGARCIASKSQVVVTNHALLFRDIQADNAILPEVKHWVVDEAHAAEQEARKQLSFQVSAQGIESYLNRLGGTHGTLAQIRRRSIELEGGVVLQGRCTLAQQQLDRVRSVALSFFSFVKELGELSQDRGSGYDRVTMWVDRRVRESGPWASLESPGRSLGRKLDELVRTLTELLASVQDFEELAVLAADLNAGLCRLDEMLAALNLVLEGTDQDFVYSATLDRGTEKPAEELRAERLDVGAVLAADFYPNVSSVIYTSATLATGTREPFAYFEHGTGLDQLSPERRPALQLASSYDFNANMRVLLPQGFPEPASPAYRPQLAQLLLEVHRAMGGSVLTLFTNRREMEALYRELKPQLAQAGIELIAQTRGISTKSLRDRFLADRELSLFALRSFWEGFDAPGETLRCVVIPKLPFGRPNDPLSCEREQREGRGAWGRYSLPEAVMDLKQAAGRLIRNSTDRGFLVLADGRLQTKYYGKTFLNALPTGNIRVVPAKEIARIMEEEA